VFVAGDHDDGARRTRVVDVREAYTFEAGDRALYCVHDPADAPPAHDGWVVHGHHHDMPPGRRTRTRPAACRGGGRGPPSRRGPAEYAFVDPAARRVNVGVELLGYRPIPLDELVSYLDRGERLEQRPRRDG
jgi:calcineurin-like phosphoesterase family protein